MCDHVREREGRCERERERGRDERERGRDERVCKLEMDIERGGGGWGDVAIIAWVTWVKYTVPADIYLIY